MLVHITCSCKIAAGRYSGVRFLVTYTSSTGSEYYCDNQYTNTRVPLCVCSVAVCAVSKAVIIDM